ncbi:MAG: hypothetical protein KatS3mg081_2632 [Gemmatimonadales bacterium]|nr:MAG: hypothetical protein KatS3mg081_2632 [Gemmatimonadales bacterium]
MSDFPFLSRHSIMPPGRQSTVSTITATWDMTSYGPDQPYHLLLLGQTAGLYPPEGPNTAPILRPGKPLCLLAYLALSPGRSVRRERLLDLFWADLSPTAARHALRQMIYHLRKTTRRDTLHADETELRLTLPLTVDAQEFVAAAEHGDLETAFDLYSGEFLPDFASPGSAEFEHWADLQRRRLQLLFLEIAQALTLRHLDRGNSRAALETARRARRLAPEHELPRRLLVETYLSAGQLPLALAEAQDLESWLGHTGKVPEPATAALLARVRRLLDPTRGEPDTPDSTEPASLEPPLVGREREFDACISAWHSALRGKVHLHLSSPAGLGKTRLLHDLANRFQAMGVPVVRVHPSAAYKSIPYVLAAQVTSELVALPGAKGISPAAVSSLLALNPTVSSHLPGTPDTSTGAEALRRRTLALAELLGCCADEAPFVLLVDDLHWGDRESLQLLGGALASTERSRYLAITAARPVAGIRAALASARVLELAPLSVSEVEALVAGLGNLDPALEQTFPRQLHRASRGSPLLVLETLRFLIEQELVSLDESGWHSRDRSSLETILAEGSAITRRVENLPAEARRLVNLLACAEAPLSLEILSQASGMSLEQCRTALGELELAGIATRSETEWQLSHDEIGRAAVETMKPEEQARTHRALGRVLKNESNPLSLARAARHLLAADDRDTLGLLLAEHLASRRKNRDRRPAPTIAAELLGLEGDEPILKELVKRLPWRSRLPWTPRTVTAASLAATAGGLALFAAWMETKPRELPVAVGIWVQEPNGQWRLHARKLTERDLEKGELSLSSLTPTSLVSPQRPGGIPQPAPELALATTITFPDPGGEDLVLIRPGSAAPVRLTYRPGDDYLGSWSPDGRYLAIQTDRWTQTSRSDVAVLDPTRPDSIVHRLSNSPETIDATALWSPDGTRVAFFRGPSSRAPSAICVVSADGEQEHCYRPSGVTMSQLLAWSDPLVLVVGLFDSTGVYRIAALELGTGQMRILAEGLPAPAASTAPGWVAAYCRRSPAEPFQTLLLPTGNPERAIRVAGGDSVPVLLLYRTGEDRQYLDRVRIANAEGPIHEDALHRLALRGWDAAGREVEPQAVRWMSADTSIATVDSLGVLHPRRQGKVLIRATAGGWRPDSVVVTIGPPRSSTRISENWERGITETWVPFGTPAPYVTRVGGRWALVPNGDSTFLSGVYSRRRLEARQGVGAEFEIATPFTSPIWQHIELSLLFATPQETASWDLALGRVGVSPEPWRSCILHYPATETPSGQSWALVAWGVQRLVPVPPSLPRGEWTRVRLQLFPDGRCGVAIGGQALAILDPGLNLRDSVFVLVWDRSHRTRILVGEVVAWEGVRGDVDWSAAR